MSENRVVALRRKGAIDDPLTEILRAGARRLIAQAVEAEFETFLASNAELVLAEAIVSAWFATGMIRFAPPRWQLQPVCSGKPPKARDRGADDGRVNTLHVDSVDWWAGSKSLDARLLPLELRGISAGDFQHAHGARPRPRRRPGGLTHL